MFRRHCMVFVLLMLMLLAGACQRVYTFVPVEGTVTQNGQPLVGVQVVFFPDPDTGIKGPRSSAITDKDGHYRLRSDQGNDGAVVGRHRVCVIESPTQDRISKIRRLNNVVSNDQAEKIAKELGLKMDEEPAKPKLPKIYGPIQETPLRAQVRPGGLQTFNFNIPPK